MCMIQVPDSTTSRFIISSVPIVNLGITYKPSQTVLKNIYCMHGDSCEHIDSGKIPGV